MITWHDIAVADADALSDFYCSVAGWEKEGLSMGDYNDYVMKDASGNIMGGICHAKGMNKELPPFWLMYIPVENIDRSMELCKQMGGKVGEKRKMGEGFYCLIQDPAGAYVMLSEGSYQ